MVEEIWQKVSKRRRNRYAEMVNESLGSTPLSLEDEEIRDNEWKLPDEPTQSDRDFVDSWDHTKKPDAWEQYETKEWDYDEKEYKKDWRLKDVKTREEYDVKSKRIKEYDGKKNWKETRLLPKEYYARKDEIEQGNGLPVMWMVPQVTDGLHSIQVLFPSWFQHLTNEEGQNQKQATKARYHISMGYEPGWNKDGTLKDDKGFTQALYDFYNRYFDPVPNKDGEWEWKERGLGKKTRVSSGGTYELQDEEDDFIRDMNYLSRWGTKKGWAHISLD
jgi:hypothetical protein